LLPGFPNTGKGSRGDRLRKATEENSKKMFLKPHLAGLPWERKPTHNTTGASSRAGPKPHLTKKQTTTTCEGEAAII